MKLFFDLDGTLFHTLPCEIAAVGQLFATLHLPPPDEERIRQQIGRTTDIFLRALLPSQIAPESVRERFRAAERRAIREQGTLFPGVPDLLAALAAQGQELILLSNGSPDYLNLVLDATGIASYFQTRYSAGAYSSKAELLRHILIPGEAAVVIGDTASDLEAAAKNQLPFICAAYGFGDAETLAAATFCARDAAEIAALVTQLDVFFRLKRRLFTPGKRIIGINGVDTSGKTIFSERFARFLEITGLKTAVLHLDDFHNPAEVRRQGENEVDAYYQHAFDYEKVCREILAPLQRDGRLDRDVMCLSLDTDRYEVRRHFSLDAETVLLIEGVLLFREPLAAYLDGRIYLQISFEEVLRRAAVRDVPKYGQAILTRYVEKYLPVQKRYLAECDPLRQSDVVLDHEDWRFPKILRI